MKKLKASEIVLLMLPLAFISGLAWWKNGQVELPVFIPTPPPPSVPHLAFTPFEKVQVTPLDVSRDTHWKARTTLETQGEPDLPPSLKEMGAWTYETNARLGYRRGAVWKTIDPSVSGTYLQAGTKRREFFLKTNFKGVPDDAEELRLRGRIQCFKWLSGTLPLGWKPPHNLQSGMSGYLLTIESEPFDLSLKAPGEPMPLPVVSHVPLLELRGIQWLRYPSPYSPRQKFFLHLHHRTKSNWNPQEVIMENAHLRDADGHEIPLYEKDGMGRRTMMKALNASSLVSMDQLKSGHDLLLSPVEDGVSPRGGWSQPKQPLHLSMDLSDGTCWPAKIDVTFRSETKVQGKSKKSAVTPRLP